MSTGAPGPWASPGEPSGQALDKAVRVRRPAPLLAAVAGSVALAVGAGFFAKNLVNDLQGCSSEGPRLAADMEIFLRENAGGLAYGPAEVEICDSTIGVAVGLSPREAQPDASALLASLTAAGCSSGPDRGVRFEVRTCTLPGGQPILVEVLKRGELYVRGSHDLRR